MCKCPLTYNKCKINCVMKPCCVCSVCVSMPLSCAVVAELYQEGLVTEGDLERMNRESGELADRLVSVQCTKHPQVATKSADVLDKFGYREEADKLRGW